METLATERGFRDILGHEAASIERIIEEAKRHFESYGYSPLILPLVEPTELFVRGLGSEVDIIAKEIFFVSDAHTKDPAEARRRCLRPESTASAARMYIERGFAKTQPVQKFYYSGPMFRNERPQKGRYRQFHQVGAECFGSASPLADVEVISMLWTFLECRVEHSLNLKLNSLGCSSCRPRFVAALINYLGNNEGRLCDDCKRRITTNPLRVLDCKKTGCEPVIRSSPKIDSSWCDDCKKHMTEVEDTLDSLKILFDRDPYLVRGLDYYTRTVFEVQVEGWGAQNAVAAGGRYDGLVELLGGPPTPALGFAMGIERLALVEKRNAPSIHRLYVAATSPETRKEAIKCANALRKDLLDRGKRARVWTDLAHRSLKAQLDLARKAECQIVIIVGDEELKQGQVIVRHMGTKEQELVHTRELADAVSRKLT